MQMPFLLAIATAVTWTCAEPEWMGSPEIHDGMLNAAVGSDCRLRNVSQSGPSKLLRFLRSDVESAERYEVHAGPDPMRRHGLVGYRYDLTDRLQEDGAPIAIRQDLFLGSDEKTRFVYATKSTQVEAGGDAAYLRKVSFRTDMIHLDGGDYLLRVENEVTVERPWFALSFLFKPIGKRITREKFLLARQKVLEYFTPHL